MSYFQWTSYVYLWGIETVRSWEKNKGRESTDGKVCCDLMVLDLLDT